MDKSDDDITSKHDNETTIADDDDITGNPNDDGIADKRDHDNCLADNHDGGIGAKADGDASGVAQGWVGGAAERRRSVAYATTSLGARGPANSLRTCCRICDVFGRADGLPTKRAAVSERAAFEVAGARKAAAARFIGLVTEVRLGPAEAGVGLGLRLVFGADVAFVAFFIEQLEQEGVVDFAGAGLVATGVVGDLHVRDARQVGLDGRAQIALHDLHVINVVLQVQIRR